MLNSLETVAPQLVDPYCGIITEVSRRLVPPGFPPVFLYAGTLAAPYFYQTSHPPTRYTERRTHVAGCGMTYEDAMWRMLGEGVERYCAVNADETRIIRASYKELGNSAVSPLAWIGYVGEEAEHARFQFNPAAPMHWTEAHDLSTGKAIFVPASLVWLDVPLFRNGDKFHQTTSSGLAAGRTKDDAIASALSELIERDCFMSRWMLGSLPPKIGADDPAILGLDKSLREMFEKGPLKAELFDLSIDAPDHTVLGKVSLSNLDGFGIALGACAHIDRAKAAEKAIVEALQICISLVNRRDRVKGELPLEKVDSFLDHADFYAQSGAAADVDFFFSGGKILNRSVTRTNFLRSYERHLAYLSGHDISTLVVDITTPDVSEIGFHVVRCLAPGLQPLTHGYGNHTVDRKRLSQLAPLLGLPRDFAVNTMLHPFA